MFRGQPSASAATAFVSCVSYYVTRCGKGRVCMIASWKLWMLSSSLYEPQWLIFFGLFVIRVILQLVACQYDGSYWICIVNFVFVQVSSNSASDFAVCWLELGCGAGSGGSECFPFFYRGCPRLAGAYTTPVCKFILCQSYNCKFRFYPIMLLSYHGTLEQTIL